MEDTKKLGLILSGIVLIIIIIVGIYFITNIFKVKDDNIITTTTKSIDAGFKNLTKEEQVSLNRYLNDENLVIAFNNAFDNNYDIKNINLLETEGSKFKFIYTYLNLNEINTNINIEILNEYSKNIFNTELYEANLTSYLKDDYYEYEIKYQKQNYCLKAYKKKNDVILMNMIEYNEVYCQADYIEYAESIVLKKIELKLKESNDDYIYESFVIVK